ncbi:hypothetical protein [Clostridium sporogenes]
MSNITWGFVLSVMTFNFLGLIYWFIYIPVIFFYFYNFHSLYKLVDNLEGIKFKNSDETVRTESKKHVLEYIIGCAFIVIICDLGSNHIRLDSTEFITTKASETRDMLMNMGFPETISDDEVDKLKEAIHIDVSSELLMRKQREKI